MSDKAITKDVVHIIDDDDEIRGLVERVLRSVGLECICWESPDAFLDALEGLAIDALVVDIRMVGRSGLELLREVRERGVSAPLIFVSGVNDVSVAVEAMRLGACDFLPKPFPAQRLIDSVQSAIRRYHDSASRNALAAQARTRLSSLSPREEQVLLAVVDGSANKVIAIDLGLSEKTVEEHRARLMAKLGASSVPDLVKLAILAGVVDPASPTGRPKS